MRNKHAHIAADSALLKVIYRQVDEELVTNPKTFARMLWLKFLTYFPLMVVAYAALYCMHNTTAFIACFIGYGLLSILFAFNFSHDCSHNTVFKSKRANNLGFTLIYTLVGAHAAAWKHRHIQSHHYAPNVEAYDSDLKISKLIRVVPGSEYRWYHRLQPYYAPFAYTTYSLFWIFIKDFVILFSKDEYTRRKGIAYHLSFWLQKMVYILYLLALLLMYAPQPWYIVIAGFLAMHLFQSLFLLFTFFMTHHVESTQYPTTDEQGTIDTSWLMNQVGSSNDMHPFSPLANFLLGGFNNHIAHHLFPHIHHIYYPCLSRLLYDTLSQHNIQPNQTTYRGGIVSHFRLLKRMSRPPVPDANNDHPLKTPLNPLAHLRL